MKSNYSRTVHACKKGLLTIHSRSKNPKDFSRKCCPCRRLREKSCSCRVPLSKAAIMLLLQKCFFTKIVFHMNLAGRLQQLLRSAAPKRYYFEDALITTHNHSFVDDPAFTNAYARGLKASGGKDWHNRWRVYLALWVARMCSQIEGDFVECGVNYGFTSSAIMQQLNWDRLGKKFWLIDSFAGIDAKQSTEQEKALGAVERSETNKRTGFYNSDAERCRANFSEWKNAHVIEGWIPDCLNQVTSAKVAFMHIDLNAVVPEIEAFKYFRSKLSHGAFILLDDYAYSGADLTFAGWSKAAKELNFEILALPTGQGLIHN